MSEKPSPSSKAKMDPNAPLTPAQLEAARKAQILDKDGKKHSFGEVIEGRRVAVVFVRHWWCTICRTYIAQLSSLVPPQNLPEGTALIVVGCGSYEPINVFAEATRTPYEVYANPDLKLYTTFGFVSTLAGAKKGEEKEYEKDLGGIAKRALGGLVGPFKNPSHIGKNGPVGQNGGELLFEPDGSCSFIHRMQHTSDHTEIRDFAAVMGAECAPPPSPTSPGGSARVEKVASAQPQSPVAA